MAEPAEVFDNQSFILNSFIMDRVEGVAELVLSEDANGNSVWFGEFAFGPICKEDEVIEERGFKVVFICLDAGWAAVCGFGEAEIAESGPC